jgi:hypothetical protein
MTDMMEGKTTRVARTGFRASLLVPSLILGLAITLGACSTKKASFDSGLPGMRTGMVVEAVTPRGPYLEAKLKMEHRDLEAYVLPTDECRAVFQVSETVSHVASGPQGRYRRGDNQCDGLGVGNLEFWRDRTRRTTKRGIPREQASFRVLYSDDEVALLRGTFPLASYLGFSGASDVVAVVPRSPECEGTIEKGVASMEFRGKGKRVLSLLGGKEPCLVRGLIQPPSQTPPAESAE